jgi:diguanylate cyclase (GGDEF)-like protein
LKLDEVLSYESARSQRDKTPLTIAIIDIDKFKSVNDTYGHQVGDKVLVGVADVMLNNIRATDILGRWGGEEFMLILPNTSLEHASVHADKLREIVEQSNFSPVSRVTISMGLSSCANFVYQKQLIELADNALYEAKENGRNRIEVAKMLTDWPAEFNELEEMSS